MLEKIVTDLESSKRLKELGVELKTEFYWTQDITAMALDGSGDIILGEYKVKYARWYDDHYKAYTLEQILEVLPDEIKNGEYIFTMWKEEMQYTWNIIGPKRDHSYYTFNEVDDNLATTAAKLLIKLLEDKVITIEEVNK